MNYFVGIDVGSQVVKLCLLNENNEIIAREKVNVGSDVDRALSAGYGTLISHIDGNETLIKCIVACGYGRRIVKFAQYTYTEITCHVQGVRFHLPDIHTVIDIGAQDVKAIQVDAQGKVEDFTVTDKCAAGTGRFLDSIALTLNVPVSDFINYLNNSLVIPVPISSTCTVFAESEIVTLISAGKKVVEIIPGLLYSVVDRILRLVNRIKIETPIVLTGGVAQNSAVVKVISEKITHPLTTVPEPQFMGSLGAAVLAKQKYEAE